VSDRSTLLCTLQNSARNAIAATRPTLFGCSHRQRPRCYGSKRVGISSGSSKQAKAAICPGVVRSAIRAMPWKSMGRGSLVLATTSSLVWLRSDKLYLLLTRYSGYILPMRWIHLQSSDVTFLGDSVYQKLLKSVYFSL